MLGFRFSYLYKLHTESFMGFNAVSLPGNPPGAFFRSSLPATPVSTPIRENGRFSEQALRERLCRTPSPRKCRLFESRISEPDVGFNSLQCGLQLSSPDDEINEDMPSVFSPVRPSVESRLENLEHEKENAPLSRLNRRIFVGNIGCKVTKKELQDFFSKFGKVVDCLIVLDHIRKQPRGYGFVIFACQQDAERARNASESDLEFDGRVLKVFPAEEKRTSKHRKEAREMVLQQKIENGDTDNFNQRISRSHSLKNINEMNDDMLLLIFSYLDIKERIKLELVCKKWQNLACNLWKSQESLSYQDFFAFWEDYRLTNGILKNILRKSSSRLKRLDLSEVSHMLDYQAVEIIATYCHCLEYVNLSTLKITNVSVQQLAKKCRMIKSLTLQNCLEVGEKGIWWLFHLSKNLEYLDLTGNPRITGQCFHVAGSNLRAIILDNCSRFSAGGFTKLATKCRLLTTLKLNDCNQLTDRALELLCQCLKNLKTFHLGGTFPHLTSSGLHHVGRLNNLEELSLQSNHLVDDDTVYAISRGCRKLRFLDISACYPGVSDYSLSSLSPCYNLRTLHISYLNKITDEGLSSISRQGLLEVIECRGCCRVSDQGFLAIVVLCPYLRHLDVSGCHRVTNVTVTACLDTIQARHSKDKLLIIVGGTSVELEALELNDSLLEVSRQNLCCKRFHSMDENSDWFSSEGSSDEGAVGGDGITPLIPSGDYLFGEDPSVDPTILFDNDWSEVHESPL